MPACENELVSGSVGAPSGDGQAETLKSADGIDSNSASTTGSAGGLGAAPTEETDRTGWPIDLSNVEVVRERQSTFIVYIDKEQRVRWHTLFPPATLSNESQALITRARLIASFPTSYFKEGQKKAWIEMIAESLALALSGDVENSKRSLSIAETFVCARARETARVWYVKASLCAFFGLIVAGISMSLVPLGLMSLAAIGLPVSETVSRFVDVIGMAVVFGAVGAEFSILLRLSTLNVDPGAGRMAHYIDAIIRILMGAFAAIIAVIAVQAHIVLGFVTSSGEADENIWLFPTVALLAGVSERFVPGILHKVETSLLEKESAVDGANLADAQPRDTKATQPAAV